MKRHYKIGILIDQLIIGGVQKIALEDARALKKMGHGVKLLVLMRKGYQNKFKDFSKGVDIRFLSDSYPTPLKHSIKFPIFSFFSTLHILSPFLAPFTIKKNEYDIIVSHGTTTCFTAQRLKKTRGIPYLALIHDPMNYILKVAYQNSSLRLLIPILKPFLKYLEKNLINDSEEVLLLSKLHQGYISKTYKTKTTILPAATRVTYKLPRNYRNFILASTRWETNKNPELFLQIARQIPNAKVIIAGTWSNSDEFIKFKNEIKKQKLLSQIRLHPYIPEDELIKLYQGARVFIHPIKEAFSMGGLEAAVNGCPIIIPQGSGITNYLQNGTDGIFIKNPTNKNFIKATKAIWQNPSLATKMGALARSKVQNFSWENHAKKLLDIIDQTLETKTINIVALETGHSSESYLSGGDKLLEKMAGYLPSNIKITVIVPKIGTGHWQEAKLANVSLVTLPQTFFDNKSNPSMIFLAYLNRIWHTYWILRKIKNKDIIYSSTNVLPDIAPAFAYRLTNKDVYWVARVHHLVAYPFIRPGRLSVNIVSSFMQSISNFMIKHKSSVTIALNRNLSKSLIKRGFSKENLKIVGAGIETAKIQKEKPFINKKFDAVFVGRLHPSKGIYDLVEIWKLVSVEKPDLKATVIGGGTKDEIKRLKFHIKQANMENNLILSGYLSEKNLIRTLKSSRIFLFTDHEAGWSLAIAEAMAAGVPIIGYNSDIFNDVYHRGFVTVPIGNTNMFAKEILQLLDDKRKYYKLQKDALAQAKILGWEETTERFTNIIMNLKISKFYQVSG